MRYWWFSFVSGIVCVCVWFRLRWLRFIMLVCYVVVWMVLVFWGCCVVKLFVSVIIWFCVVCFVCVFC